MPSGYPTYAWTHDGVPIGGNDAFVLTEGDGLYAVTVDAGSGCILTEEYLLITTGVAEGRSAEMRFSVFPLPNNGVFTAVAEGLSGDAVWLRLLDVTGRVLMLRAEVPSGGALRTEVAVSVAPGTYVLQLVDGGRTHVLRLVIR